MRRFSSSLRTSSDVVPLLIAAMFDSEAKTTNVYKSRYTGQGHGFRKSPSTAAAESGPSRSSCVEEEGPVKAKPLTALQRRMMEQKDKAAFSLTPTAVYRVKHLLQMHHTNHPDDEQPQGIRIGVKKRGCSGYSYTVNYEYANKGQKKPNDTKVDQSGVSVFVDGDALFYVIGTNMDFTTTNVEEKFTFTNPNQKHQCGCGESFMPFDV